MQSEEKTDETDHGLQKKKGEKCFYVYIDFIFFFCLKKTEVREE